MLIWIFGVHLHILPPSGRLTVGVELQTITNIHILDSILTGNWKAFKDALSHIIMPAVALSAIPIVYGNLISNTSSV